MEDFVKKEVFCETRADGTKLYYASATQRYKWFNLINFDTVYWVRLTGRDILRDSILIEGRSLAQSFTTESLARLALAEALRKYSAEALKKQIVSFKKIE